MVHGNPGRYVLDLHALVKETGRPVGLPHLFPLAHRPARGAFRVPRLPLLLCGVGSPGTLRHDGRTDEHPPPGRATAPDPRDLKGVRHDA
ncbi:predicted protein [Streptomyces sp. SPB78]|nr:predicted protein [Streptomyces sp. SPB78]